MNGTVTPENKPSGYGKSNWVKMILIYVVVGGLLYAGLYYFVLAKKGTGYNQTQVPPVYTQPSAPVMTPPQSSPAAVVPEAQNEVVLSAEGFGPQTLNIKTGESVTWKNGSGGTATVNSDPHPIHTNYPPLNLGRFNDGETLTLIFDKPGNYGYHNHLNPSQTGKIIVE